MFKLSSSFVLSAILACATVASAGPTPLDVRAIAVPDATTTITVCNDVNGAHGPGMCLNIPIGNGDCINLNTGSYQALYKEISSATIPGGVVCTFYESLGCASAPNGNDVAILNASAGTSAFRSLNGVPGRHGAINFDNRTGSLSCSTADRSQTAPL